MFGIPAATNTLTSRLARHDRRGGAAVLPRAPAGHAGLPSPPSIRRSKTSPATAPSADTARFNQLIEAQVRMAPEQYLWIHRRFKGLTAGLPGLLRPAGAAPRRRAHAAADSCDLLVVGGGDQRHRHRARCRRARPAVLLCEQDDLAAHTSSASTKLIHGGLRYLEDFHFALVRKALMEREVLLSAAPHIMRPLHFVMPHDAHLRPAWMIRAGPVSLRSPGAPRAPGRLGRHRPAASTSPASRSRRGYRRGFVYSDGWVDDARLVVLNALDAAGARRHRAARARAASGSSRARTQAGRATLRRTRGAQPEVVRARAVVNATGPWVSRVPRRTRRRCRRSARVRLVKGSHIVVPTLFAHRFAYIFQNRRPPHRVRDPLRARIHAHRHHGCRLPRRAAAGAHRRSRRSRYLCDIANRYFVRPIDAADVAWTLFRGAPAAGRRGDRPRERDARLRARAGYPAAPLLSVFGGKITTYRKLAETAVDRSLGNWARTRSAPWTRTRVLPGGDLPGAASPCSCGHSSDATHGFPPHLRVRYAQAYGTRIDARDR